MPQRTSAALSVNWAVGSDPVGRGRDDTLYLAVAVGFVYFQYLYFKLVPYSSCLLYTSDAADEL